MMPRSAAACPSDDMPTVMARQGHLEHRDIDDEVAINENSDSARFARRAGTGERQMIDSCVQAAIRRDRDPVQARGVGDPDLILAHGHDEPRSPKPCPRCTAYLPAPVPVPGAVPGSSTGRRRCRRREALHRRRGEGWHPVALIHCKQQALPFLRPGPGRQAPRPRTRPRTIHTSRHRRHRSHRNCPSRSPSHQRRFGSHR